ncbi:helix-turn-helix domain-containing protein [Streptomyces chumphonensis]|uniref:helix-turn-helix domain-containing protein n=1 Tax=Streptomyces chumphonensis TaxID=1214925 RepID=UPI003D719495
MSDVRIVSLDTGKLALVSPYHPDMPADARKIGGKWDRDNKAWIFDPRDENRVREMARRYFGTDGSSEADADLVTVRVDLGAYEREQTARFAGRVIARRRSRDADIELGRDVVLVEGRLAGPGGSVRYPQLGVADGTIVEIRDLPRAALQAEDVEDYEIVESTVDTDALRAKRARLLQELAETEQALADAGEPVDQDPPAPGRAVPAEHGSALVVTVHLPEQDSEGAGTAAFAAACGKSVRTVRRWCASGRVPARRVGNRWLITA